MSNQEITTELIRAEEKMPEYKETNDIITEDETTAGIPQEDEGDVKSKKTRRVPTRDTILSNFDSILESLTEEITNLRENPTKAKGGGVRYLRTLSKQLSTLRNHSSRVIKKRKNTVKRASNPKYGFGTPVPVSDEMSRFAGWELGTLKSRVDVTNLICTYIRDNKLQNPDDRRIIIPDTKLAELLQVHLLPDDKPLTYFRIQMCMKHHFPKKIPSEAKESKNDEESL